MENENVQNIISKKFRSTKLELKIISYCLRRDWKIIEQLKIDYFTIEPLRVFLQEIQKAKSEFPKDLFYQQIKGLKEIREDIEIYKTYIVKIYQEDLKNITTKNINALVIKLKKLSDERKFFGLIDESLDNIETFDLEEQQKKFNLFFISRKIRLEGEEGEYLEDFEKRKAYLKDLKKNKNKYMITTGFKEFDDVSGGIQKGEIANIIMKTGGGKSVSLMNIGVHAWDKGYNVVKIDLEMTKIQSELRMDSFVSRIEHQKFRKGELSIFDIEAWTKKIDELRKQKKNFFITKSLPRGCSTDDIETALLRIQEERKQEVDLLLVDYLNLMTQNRSSKESSRSWENQVEIAWEMKGQLAIDFNCKKGLALWTCNQLTDDGVRAKKLDTSHLKYSRGISEVFPIILGIIPSNNEELDNIMKMWIIKCRDFPPNKTPIILHPNFSYMSINDIESRNKFEEDEEDD